MVRETHNQQNIVNSSGGPSLLGIIIIIMIRNLHCTKISYFTSPSGVPGRCWKNLEAYSVCHQLEQEGLHDVVVGVVAPL